MSPRRFKVGDAVTAPGPGGKDRKATFEGRVVAYSDLAGPRQKLWVRSADNRIRMAIVDLGALAGATVQGSEPTGRLCGPPVDVATADALARLILEGREIRLPIEMQLTTLATVVLQAERPNEEVETE